MNGYVIYILYISCRDCKKKVFAGLTQASTTSNETMAVIMAASIIILPKAQLVLNNEFLLEFVAVVVDPIFGRAEGSTR